MDALGLQTLASELEADVAVVVAAIDLAGRRCAEETPSGHDSAAYHLSRGYHVIEQMALRVAKVFENNVDDERGWHTELIRRLSIRIEGVRPPLFTDELRQPLRQRQPRAMRGSGVASVVNSRAPRTLTSITPLAPEPHFALAEPAVDVQLVDAPGRPDHLDRQIRPGGPAGAHRVALVGLERPRAPRLLERP